MALSRSEHMARVRGRDTGPERVLRSALWAAGLRYRKQRRLGRARPDVVFVGAKVAVFVDGCFWHGCPRHYVLPRTRVGFWGEKLRDNVDRDRAQTRRLEQDGWRVLRFWEHEIYESLDRVVAAVAGSVRDDELPAGERRRIRSVEPLADGVERRYLVALREPASLRVEEGPRNSNSYQRPPRR